MGSNAVGELFGDGWNVRSIERACFELIEGTVFAADTASLAWLARVERC